MENLIATSRELVIRVDTNYIRDMHQEIDWNSRLIAILGSRGTGKTTIIKAIIHMLEKDGKTCFLAAPTGRAAKRMALACGKQAKTIHRLLEIDYKEERILKELSY